MEHGWSPITARNQPRAGSEYFSPGHYHTADCRYAVTHLQAKRQSSLIKIRKLVNIENTGSLKWTADKTIAAFPRFAMVIVDTRGRVVVSQPFAIQSLTRQPSQQSGGSKTGIDEKQNADKNGGQKGGSIQNEKGHGTGSEGGGKATGGKEGTNKQQKEQTGTENDTSSKLIALPGLPTNNGESASLQPLPNAATTTIATSTSIEVPGEVPTVIGIIKNTKQPLVVSASPSLPAADKQSRQRPTTLNSLPPASTALPQQAKAVDGPSEAKSQLGQGFSVIKGSFREQTNIPVPVPLPSLKGQVTITTAITPRPLGQVSATDISSRTNTPSAAGAAQPTVLSGGQRLSPNHVLWLVCVSFGWGLLSMATVTAL